MKPRQTARLLPALLLLATTRLFAASSAETVEVSGAYARAVPPGQPNSAAFMTLSNASARPIALVNARSGVAKVVELHTHLMEEGMMRMRQVEKIDIPANGEARLQPGGDHVMFIGLVEDLEPGAEVAFTLVFDDGSEKQVVAPVQKVQMKMMKHGDPHKMQ